MKKSLPSWKIVVLTAVVAFLGIRYDAGSYIFFHDFGLWEQAGWKSHGDENLERVKFLLWLGADPSYVHDDGHGPVSVLENAVEWSNLEIIDVLLPLVPEEVRISAMDYACRRGMNESAVFLSQKGIVPSHPVDPAKLATKLPGVCMESS